MEVEFCDETFFPDEKKKSSRQISYPPLRIRISIAYLKYLLTGFIFRPIAKMRRDHAPTYICLGTIHT